MKDPERLKTANPDAARLIEAMRRERPSDVQMNKALNRASETASLSGGRAVSGWFGRSSTWLRIAMAGTAIVGGIVATTTVSKTTGRETANADLVAANDATTTGASHEPESSSTTQSPPVAAASIDSDDRTRIDSAPADTVRVDDLPPAAPARSLLGNAPLGARPASSKELTAVTKPRTGAASNETPAADTFADELALAADARSSLGRGDAAEALSAVKRYRQRFPHGVLAQEIDVIGIEALAKSGERSAARTAGERFLSRNETSPYAERVRSVLANADR